MIAPSKTEPPPPSTGFSNPNCYAALTADCSQQLSAEHFVSRGILEKIADNGKMLFLGGARFSPDELRKVSVTSMASKVLCDRHNSALGPLDAEAIRLFSDLLSATHHNIVRNATYCGEDFERWMLKVMAGLMYSGIVGTSDGRGVKVPPAPWMLEILFGRREFNIGAGLAIFPTDDVPNSPIEITVNSENDGTHIYGVRICLLGINFHLSTSKTIKVENGQYFHRPRRLDIAEAGTFEFQWLPGKSSADLVMQKKK